MLLLLHMYYFREHLRNLRFFVDFCCCCCSHLTLKLLEDVVRRNEFVTTSMYALYKSYLLANARRSPLADINRRCERLQTTRLPGSLRYSRTHLRACWTLRFISSLSSSCFFLWYSSSSAPSSFTRRRIWNHSRWRWTGGKVTSGEAPRCFLYCNVRNTCQTVYEPF